MYAPPGTGTAMRDHVHLSEKSVRITEKAFESISQESILFFPKCVLRFDESSRTSIS